MDDFTKQIKELNDIYDKLNSSVISLEKYCSNRDLELYLYRIKKSFNDFNQEMLKELTKQNVDFEFKNITKGFDI